MVISKGVLLFLEATYVPFNLLHEVITRDYTACVKIVHVPVEREIELAQGYWLVVGVCSHLSARTEGLTVRASHVFAWENADNRFLDGPVALLSNHPAL